MSDAQKPVEVSAPAVEPTTVSTEAPAVVEPPKEVEAFATVTAAEAAVTDATPTEPAVATEAAATTTTTTEEAKKEATPIEEGHLESKGTKFPQNFIYAKRFFWFGSDAVELKTLSSFVKSEKSSEAAQGISAWASHTGEGLLFFTEKGTEKTSPSGAILLSEASEPTADGPNKFHFTVKGQKHTFRAASAAERDNWVAQIKAKSAAAKEHAATVTESETYKTTLESFRPTPVAAPVKKSEEAKVEEPVVSTAPAEAKEAEVPKTEEPVAVKDEKKEETQRRSASRKRASIFGSFLGSKKEEKKEVKKEDTPTDEAAAPAEVAATDAATEVAPAAAAEAPAAPAEVDAATEAPVEEEKKDETAAVKPVPVKRNSIFGNLSFGKKKPSEQTVPAKEATADAGPVADAAPVIPAVETQAPLSAEVTSPVTVTVETIDATVPFASDGEVAKREVKNEKRKSSLPFAFGKKDKATTSDEEGEKAPKSPSAFSKLRATIKGKGKPAEKTAEKVEATPEETAEATNEAEAVKPAETTVAKTEEPIEAGVVAPAVVAEETPKPVTVAPVVAASA